MIRMIQTLRGIEVAVVVYMVVMRLLVELFRYRGSAHLTKQAMLVARPLSWG